MANEELKSIDDYELFLSETLDTWSTEQRLAFAAGMTERWWHTYETFSAAEAWGDPESLRRILEAVWNHLGGRRLTPAHLARYTQQLHDSTPHMDDFDAPEALAVCVMLGEALGCCGRASNLGFAVQAALSGFEAVMPDWSLDPEVQPRLWQKSAIRKEMKAQLRLVKQIGAISHFDDQVIEALRRDLTKPGALGRVPARSEPTGPTLLTNQVAFEQYRRMVESDLKSRGQIDLTGDPLADVLILFSEWLGRYSRRLDTLTGNYGRLADVPALAALAARQRARDAANKTVLDLDPDVRDMINLSLHHCHMANRVDASSLDQPHSHGPSLRQLWAEAKERGAPDDAAWQTVIAWARHRPAVWAVEDRRKKKGLVYATPELGQALAQELVWTATADLDYPWAAEVKGARWQIRLNDFPDEIMYSLVIDGVVLGDFHDWPETWRRE